MAKKDSTTETTEQYHQRTVDLLCGATVDSDKGLKRICDAFRKEDPGFPAARTIRGWFEADAELFAQYARAKEQQVEHLVDQVVEISDDDSLDIAFKEDGTPYTNTEHIQRSKLRVDSRKWIASKLLPKKYGDKITMAGDGDNPLVIKHKHDLSEEELIAIATGRGN